MASTLNQRLLKVIGNGALVLHISPTELQCNNWNSCLTRLFVNK